MAQHPGYPSLAQIDAVARRSNLTVLGAFHPRASDGAPGGCGTLVLFGPLEPGFWNTFHKSEEFNDQRSNPLDRWSKRTITTIADRFDADPVFPFGGPPYAPFIQWAVRTGRAWPSPVGLLVHDTAGLFLSYRGAIALPGALDLPILPASPCLSCKDRPCQTTCPVDAFAAASYDTAACHAYLDSAPGQDCMTLGCSVRRACPVSQSYARKPAQSAFHMKAFHP